MIVDGFDVGERWRFGTVERYPTLCFNRIYRKACRFPALEPFHICYSIPALPLSPHPNIRAIEVSSLE